MELTYMALAWLAVVLAAFGITIGLIEFAAAVWRLSQDVVEVATRPPEASVREFNRET